MNQADLNEKKIAVVGVGGVGGYMAAMLAKTFPHVAVVARGKRGESIRGRGLVLHSDYSGEIVSHPELVAESAQELEPQDVIFVCVKNYSLEEACAQMKSAVTDETIIIPVMNGVDPGDRVRAYLGTGIVMDAVIYIVSFANADDSITQQGDFTDLRFGIPEENVRKAPDAELISQKILEAAAILEAAGIDYKVSEDIECDIWKKYILNCAYNVETAYYNLPIGELRSDSKKAKEFEQLVYEAFEVAK
ncbi:MAG: 2-dehydropantoate 2-reductase, partial [Hespellia sp.]|nr:2-dehydropantoate 2-reductase [Hespellia sp.]